MEKTLLIIAETLQIIAKELQEINNTLKARDKIDNLPKLSDTIFGRKVF